MLVETPLWLTDREAVQWRLSKGGSPERETLLTLSDLRARLEYQSFLTEEAVRNLSRWHAENIRFQGELIRYFGQLLPFIADPTAVRDVKKFVVELKKAMAGTQ